MYIVCSLNPLQYNYNMFYSCLIISPQFYSIADKIYCAGWKQLFNYFYTHLQSVKVLRLFLSNFCTFSFYILWSIHVLGLVACYHSTSIYLCLIGQPEDIFPHGWLWCMAFGILLDFIRGRCFVHRLYYCNMKCITGFLSKFIYFILFIRFSFCQIDFNAFHSILKKPKKENWMKMNKFRKEKRLHVQFLALPQF